MQYHRPTPLEPLERRLKHQFGLPDHLARSIYEMRQNEARRR